MGFSFENFLELPVLPIVAYFVKIYIRRSLYFRCLVHWGCESFNCILYFQPLLLRDLA